MNQPVSSNAPEREAAATTAAAGPAGGEGAQAPRGFGVQLPATGPVVLDASFILALLRRDPDAAALAHVLPRGVMTSITAGEVFTAIAAPGGPEPQRIEEVLRALGVRIADLNLSSVHHLPKLWRIDSARRAEQAARSEEVVALSLADLCVLGYALTHKAPVLTGNRHWAALAAHGLVVPVHFYRRQS